MSGELMPKDAYLYRQGRGGNYDFNMRVPTEIAAAYSSYEVFVNYSSKT